MNDNSYLEPDMNPISSYVQYSHPGYDIITSQALHHEMNFSLGFNCIRNNRACIPSQYEPVPNLRRINPVENILASSTVAVYENILDKNDEQTDLCLSIVAVTDQNPVQIVLTLSTVTISGNTLDMNEEQTDLRSSKVAETDKSMFKLI